MTCTVKSIFLVLFFIVVPNTSGSRTSGRVGLTVYMTVILLVLPQKQKNGSSTVQKSPSSIESSLSEIQTEKCKL